ncbi:hypothetical protein BDZ85DRAFT_266437 [Elsinoe ampelina]|uniref:Uncharacterized protein n=1 Tax=Elsinoe ampelina TaxID=302913 RepID=A0A6A6G5Z6_9PEZI|nr:hypothetical protein BDZ85DRAFT_266437 [Elsinoe ampelina]
MRVSDVGLTQLALASPSYSHEERFPRRVAQYWNNSRHNHTGEPNPGSIPAGRSCKALSSAVEPSVERLAVITSGRQNSVPGHSRTYRPLVVWHRLETCRPVKMSAIGICCHSESNPRFGPDFRRLLPGDRNDGGGSRRTTRYQLLSPFTMVRIS